MKGHRHHHESMLSVEEALERVPGLLRAAGRRREAPPRRAGAGLGRGCLQPVRHTPLANSAMDGIRGSGRECRRRFQAHAGLAGGNRLRCGRAGARIPGRSRRCGAYHDRARRSLPAPMRLCHSRTPTRRPGPAPTAPFRRSSSMPRSSAPPTSGRPARMSGRGEARPRERDPSQVRGHRCARVPRLRYCDRNPSADRRHPRNRGRGGRAGGRVVARTHI